MGGWEASATLRAAAGVVIDNLREDKEKANSKIMRVTNLSNCVTVTEFETLLIPPSNAKQESR
jgi:hypothetical protein